MAVTTWDEALEGMTPQEVWALRKIRMHLRAFLFSANVEYSTNHQRHPDGYPGLKRIQVKVGKAEFVFTAKDVPQEIGLLWLALDETIYSFGNEMLKESDE